MKWAAFIIVPILAAVSALWGYTITSLDSQETRVRQLEKDAAGAQVWRAAQKETLDEIRKDVKALLKDAKR